VRSGGHSGAAHSTVDGGIVLDLRDMNALEIDVTARTAWAESGLSAGEFSEAAAAHGLAVGFGDTGSVGLGGLTLGGGVGYLARKHGLTIDSLFAADVVTADGQVLRVDETSHPDLFWAIRGGGGNCGIVTRFEFRLQEVDRVVGGMLILPATPETVAGFIAAAEAAPDELTTIANVMNCPPMPFVAEELRGSLVILANICWSGDLDDGQKVLAQFFELAEPLANFVQPMPYPGMYPPGDPDYHPTAVGRTTFVDSIGLDEATLIVERLQAPTRRCGSRSCAYSAAPWHGCQPTRPRTPTARSASWSTQPTSMAGLKTVLYARRGLRASSRLCARVTTRRTSTSSWTKDLSACALPTRARPGTGWPRSRPRTTLRTSSPATRTSRPRPPDKRGPRWRWKP
jgi:hypothetical protein